MIDKTVQSNPECICTSCTRAGKKKKARYSTVETGDRKIFARTSKYPVICFETGIGFVLPRGGGIVAKTCSPPLPLPSLLDLRRFMGNSRPPVSPTVRKQSAYDASIVELSMEIPSKLLSNFVHATLPPPPPPPSHPFMHTMRRYGGGGTGFDAVSSIICSRRVNSSRCEGAWKGIPYQPPPCPLGDKKWVNTAEPVSSSTYEFYFSAFRDSFLNSFELYNSCDSSCEIFEFNSIYFLSILYLFRVTIIYIYI